MKTAARRHPRHTRQRRTPRVSPSILERINPNVAGIDCGSAEHFVAVPPDRDPTPIQSFPTFTSDRYRLADWCSPAFACACCADHGTRGSSSPEESVPKNSWK